MLTKLMREVRAINRSKEAPDGTIVDGFSNTDNGEGRAASNAGVHGSTWGIDEALTSRGKAMFHHVLQAKQDPETRSVRREISLFRSGSVELLANLSDSPVVAALSAPAPPS